MSASTIIRPSTPRSVVLDALAPSPLHTVESIRVSDCHDTRFLMSGRIGGITRDQTGSLVVSDATTGEVWRTDRDAGSATRIPVAWADGDSGATHVGSPRGLDIGTDGTILIADATGNRILAVSASGTVNVLAGGASGFRDGPGAQALFRYPCDVVALPDGGCLVADTGNDRIRQISPDGVVTTLAGSIYDFGDGRGTHARFRRPLALTLANDGGAFVADTGNNAIRHIDSVGAVETVAGSPPGGGRDGKGRDIGLRWPMGIAVGSDDSIWIADYGNSSVRRLDSDFRSETVMRLAGRRWPNALASGGDGSIAVVATTVSGDLSPLSCVMVVPESNCVGHAGITRLRK